MLEHVRGNYAQAEDFYQQSLKLKKALDDDAEAIQLCQESLDISKALGDQVNIATTLHQLGIIAHFRGEYTEAQRFYQQSLEIAKDLGDLQGLASTLHQQAMLAVDTTPSRVVCKEEAFQRGAIEMIIQA